MYYQKHQKSILNNKDEKPQKTAEIALEKWFLIWASYIYLITMAWIVIIPISIINLIKIKQNWKKEIINIEEFKKMTYFSNDLFLITTSFVIL